MNNFVFNRTPDELKTSVYAQSAGGLKPLQLDSSDNLEVVVSQILAPVTISNASFTVSGPITVSSITNPVAVSSIADPVTIGNAAVTVNGTVAVSSITNPVAVSSIADPVTIGNATVTVNGNVAATISYHRGITSTQTNTTVTGNQIIFADTSMVDCSNATFFIYNTGTTTLTLSLQMSPAVAADYINDPNYTNVAIPAGTNKIMPVVYYGNYSRIRFNMGTTEGTVTAYFVGQC